MKLSISTRKEPTKKVQSPWWRQPMAVGLAVVLTLLFSGTAMAAQVMSGSPYILPRGEVVNDDLYVTGDEVIIDGTVEGDLIVAGGYVEVNGVVMGDLLAFGGVVVIAGTIQDDVRAAGGAVILSGSVGDDFFAAAGGGWPGAFAIPVRSIRVEDRSVPQGLQITSAATIGGDAVLAGGSGDVAGSIGGDLVAAMGTLAFAGHVAGDADLNAQSLTVSENAEVQGELRYSTSGNTTIPDGVAASVTEESPAESDVAPARNPIAGFFWWLLRTALILIGYLLAGWLLWSFVPHRIVEPVEVMTARPMEAGVIGLLAAVAIFPIAAALTFLGYIFWGWFPGGIIMFTFVISWAAMVWLLSPVFTGLWVGRILGRMTGVKGDFSHLLLGIGTIVLVARVLTVIPCLGDLLFQVIFLVSFALCVGSWILSRRRPPASSASLPAPIAPSTLVAPAAPDAPAA